MKRKKETPEAGYVKSLILDQLLKEGHKTFATLLSNPRWYLRLTDSTDIVAAISESTGEIYLNRYFTDMAAISMLIRHELLHKLFKHEANTMKILAKELGLDYDILDDLSLKQLRELAYAPSSFEGTIQNIAGDYHLSQYYTKLDREYVKSLDFYGQQIQGLLIDQLRTDNPYGVKLDPDRVSKLSFEELYDLFEEEDKRLQWEAAEHIYVDFDDEDGQKYTEAAPDHDIYIGTTNNKIIAVTDEVQSLKQLFNQCQRWYHTLIPEYLSNQIETAINNGEDFLSGMTIDDFEQQYSDFKLEPIDSIPADNKEEENDEV